ncbi:4-hydroxy-tetrahydrodipicolinate synthase [Roseisolibacter agri]|uniref:4-hydroxy-tetrahydrodipicolinate synthase n=2 Tax=Roseisolibacter agri TaxID=2014610 RepID=A0AA37Q4H9_9BACT|nr:4-hydroxy-tetrahydrodipicolinate synthase [Roseisolibacter agri]
MAPAVTPFDADGAVARASFETNVRAHVAAGLSGVVVAGSSGEAALLDEGERAALLTWARALVPSDRWLIAGIGGESTRQVIQRARVAADAGADAVLVVSPHYYGKRMSEAALHAHFTAVADASPLPVLLYNIPVYAHLVLSPELVARLSRHGNVVGMKDSAGDLATLARYVESQRDDFRVLTGHGGTWAQALALGVSGGILAVSLFAPALTLAVWEAARAGDADGAAALQARLVPLARDVVAALGPAGLKAAMTMVGLEGGVPRAPLLALDDAEREQVRAAFAAAVVPLVGAPPTPVAARGLAAAH